ncbi:MAG: MFS transporter [Bacteroidaceae bacterium]|nr:MFS transporter [Bacteroidaceae bacterium]
MAKLSEKIGYGFGDMASSMFWKIFSAYLPFFYTNVFGLPLELGAVLFLVTKLWDAVSDPVMGMLADRTQTRWGKYRPWLLYMAVPFALCGVLLLTTPDLNANGKAVWAFATYILMMTVYTAINVPYGSLLGVMTDDADEKTVFSSYRMFFAYIGSFIVLGAWEPLLGWMNAAQGLHGEYPYDAHSWQLAMGVVAAVCLVLFLLTFSLTRERVKTAPKGDVGADLASLFRNGPWWILLATVLFFNLMNAARYTTIPYFFKDVVGTEAQLAFLGVTFLFTSGVFFLVGEVANLPGVAAATPLTRLLGKKSTFGWSLVLLVPLNAAFYFIPATAGGYWAMLALQVLVCILTGVVSPLAWSMYADISDYAEHRFGTSSTGLIFSSSSMAQKFGGAFGSAAVLWLLASVGYNTAENAVQTPEALSGLRLLMSLLPAAISLIALLFLALYPLTTAKMRQIGAELKERRETVIRNPEPIN